MKTKEFLTISIGSFPNQPLYDLKMNILNADFGFDASTSTKYRTLKDMNYTKKIKKIPKKRNLNTNKNLRGVFAIEIEIMADENLKNQMKQVLIRTSYLSVVARQ